MPTGIIESLDHEARGITRLEGKTIFVEGALPGEEVEYVSFRKKPSFEVAHVQRILKASANRVTPKCPHFGVCGGCSMQHLDSAAQVAAKQTLELKTASGVVNIAAAKKVVLAVSGGASITIEGGSFTAQCPGKITVKAGKKAMVGPGTMGWQMPTFPQSVCVACMLKAMKAGSPFAAPAGA